MSKSIFLRNDDVRETLDNELVTLTQLCIDHKVPICHAVEPANVSDEVVNWLLDMKSRYPSLIEIIQHGFDHNRKNPMLKMEFGGTRNYDDQYMDIKSGKYIMDRHFNDFWSPVFTFPYGSYNFHTLRAVDQLGYRAISSKVDFSMKSMLKNKAGRIVGKDFIMDKKVSYHDIMRKHFKFQEMSVSANLIKKYTGYNSAEHFTEDEILSQIRQSSRFTNKTGLLFHHRFHTKHFAMIDDLFKELKNYKYTFSTITDLLR